MQIGKTDVTEDVREDPAAGITYTSQGDLRITTMAPGRATVEILKEGLAVTVMMKEKTKDTEILIDVTEHPPVTTIINLIQNGLTSATNTSKISFKLKYLWLYVFNSELSPKHYNNEYSGFKSLDWLRFLSNKIKIDI